MTERFTEASPRRDAGIAGVLYLLTIITGVFAEAFVRGTLFVRDDAAATATNILTNETLYRFGLSADLIMVSCYIAVTLIFYCLFKPVARSLSLLAAFFSLVGIAVLAINALNHLAPLVFLGGASSSGAFEANQLQALAQMSLRLHARGYSIAGVFFGSYMILLGYLIYRSGFLPRILGALMAIGGFGFLMNSFATFLLPALMARLPDIGMLGGIAELALSLWLIVKGVDVRKWKQRANASAH